MGRNVSRYFSNTFLAEGTDLASGRIKNASHIHKFGANFDIDTNSDPESVWTAGGLYPWDAFNTAGVLVVTSDDTDDDVGQSGATEIKVLGLDENYNATEETFTMDGTSNVTGSVTFKRVFRAFVTAGDTNVGNITVSRGGTVVAQIDADYGQTLMLVYTIPKGYTGFMLCLDASLNKAEDGNVRVHQRPFNGVFRIAHMAELFQNIYRYDFPIPLKFEEKTDIDFRIDDVESNNTRCTANFDMILVKK